MLIRYGYELALDNGMTAQSVVLKRSAAGHREAPPARIVTLGGPCDSERAFSTR
jgi:hypothetical protein